MLWDRKGKRWSGVLLVFVLFGFVFFVGFVAVGFVASFKLGVGYFLEDLFLAVGGVEAS